MKIDENDPRVTAFALGELEGSEAKEIEDALAVEPELRRAVEEVRVISERLASELQSEPVASLSEAQRARLRERAQGVVPIDRARGRRRLVLIAAVTTVAASFGLVMVGSGLFLAKQAPSVRAEAPALLATLPSQEHQALSRGEEGKLGAKRSRNRTGLYGLRGLGSAKLAESTGDTGVEPGERYGQIKENQFKSARRSPLSTFSIDVDTAAYANLRRFLGQRMLPPKDAVRIEEMVNYFPYAYPPPRGPHPFAVHLEQGPAPWNPRHTLVRIGLKGKELDLRARKPSNLVFLIDVSGSMSDANKLPLLRNAFSLLVQQLGENDRVAIAVYAGAAGLVLPSTACTEKNRSKILAAIERLEAGGSTAGGAGIQLAYQTAVASFIKGGVNRVLLATDGDFNVGTTDRDALVGMVKRRAETGVFLTVLGFGMGNLKDETLEGIANQGNGNYFYIDSLAEARKVLVEQMSGTLTTIAKDVKIQVELNPRKVSEYRLIGYENRLLAARDFADDKKDAGEIGAGHTVTALYELVPTGTDDELRYQQPSALESSGPAGNELMLVKLRYKQPDGEQSQLLKVPLADQRGVRGANSDDFRFAAAVAWFGMALRGSPFAGDLPWSKILDLGGKAKGQDPQGYRAEMLRLVEAARALKAGE
jgi:Ca-activated chloride channel family protein